MWRGEVAFLQHRIVDTIHPSFQFLSLLWLALKDAQYCPFRSASGRTTSEERYQMGRGGIAFPFFSPEDQLTSSQGLRGISGLFIVTSHLYLSLNESMRFPGESENVLGSIIRLPILRLHTLGAPWLAVFFILTGFVNAYKPIQQARKRNVSSSLTGLASSAFRRTWRLVLPSTLATILAWIMTQLGFFNLATGVGEIWLRTSSPVMIAGWWPALHALFDSIWTTWTGGINAYDKNQWCMFVLLKGSMLVYIALLATIRCTSRCRMLIFFGLYVYSCCCLDSKDTTHNIVCTKY